MSELQTVEPSVKPSAEQSMKLHVDQSDADDHYDMPCIKCGGKETHESFCPTVSNVNQTDSDDDDSDDEEEECFPCLGCGGKETHGKFCSVKSTVRKADIHHDLLNTCSGKTCVGNKGETHGSFCGFGKVNVIQNTLSSSSTTSSSTAPNSKDVKDDKKDEEKKKEEAQAMRVAIGNLIYFLDSMKTKEKTKAQMPVFCKLYATWTNIEKPEPDYNEIEHIENFLLGAKNYGFQNQKSGQKFFGLVWKRIESGEFEDDICQEVKHAWPSQGVEFQFEMSNFLISEIRKMVVNSGTK